MRKSVKSALRKKDGNAADVTSLPSHIKKSKKRSAPDDETDDQGGVTSSPDKNEAHLSMKKRRTEPTGVSEGKVKVETPSKARVVTRYGGRKGRMSPATANISGPDYDHVPKTPPTTSCGSRKRSSATRTKGGKAASSTIKPPPKEEDKKAKTAKRNTPQLHTTQTHHCAPHTPPESLQPGGRVTRSRRAATEAIETPTINEQDAVGEISVTAEVSIAALVVLSDTYN